MIAWDIAIPYEENWAFFRSVQARVVAHGCGLVLTTTTNKRALEDLVGPTPAFEIVGKPFDLEDVVIAVRRAVNAQPGVQELFNPGIAGGRRRGVILAGRAPCVQPVRRERQGRYRSGARAARWKTINPSTTIDSD